MTLTIVDLLKIEKIVDDKLDEKLDEKLDSKIKNLPTKAHFDKRMDDLTKEISNARDEFAAHTKQHTDIHDQDETNDKRFKRIEKHVNLPPYQD